MKIKIATLAIFSLAAGFVTTQAADAAESRGARFNFGKNYWSVEEPRLPVTHTPATPHSVRNGAVPKGTSFLGLEPHMLAKPAAAPQVQTQVEARPSIAQATPQMGIPKTSFNPAFGKAPGLNPPPVVASLPPAAPNMPQMTAQGQQLKPQEKANPARAMAPAKPVVAHRGPIHASKSVHGVLSHRKPSAANGMTADAGKGIDSYSSGYVPGPFLPSASGDGGMLTKTSVHGKVIHHK